MRFHIPLVIILAIGYVTGEEEEKGKIYDPTSVEANFIVTMANRLRASVGATSMLELKYTMDSAQENRMKSMINDKKACVRDMMEILPDIGVIEATPYPDNFHEFSGFIANLQDVYLPEYPVTKPDPVESCKDFGNIQTCSLIKRLLVSSSRQISCGLRICPSRQHNQPIHRSVVCFLANSSNTAPLYEKGTPCSSCPAPYSTCSKMKLCTLPQAPSTPKTTQKPMDVGLGLKSSGSIVNIDSESLAIDNFNVNL